MLCNVTRPGPVKLDKNRPSPPKTDRRSVVDTWNFTTRSPTWTQ